MFSDSVNYELHEYQLLFTTNTLQYYPVDPGLKRSEQAGNECG